MPENPRRRPTQERAQVTVDAIVEAAARLFVEDGYARATTNRIAERAGVSIGSLYHYFSSREEIVAAVLERLSERQIAATAAAFAEHRGLGAEPTVRGLVRAVLAGQRVDADLAHVLVTQAPPERTLAIDRRWKQRLTELLTTRLLAADVRPRRPELAAWVLVRAVFGVVRDAHDERPDLVHTDALVEELAELVTRYLAPEG